MGISNKNLLKKNYTLINAHKKKKEKKLWRIIFLVEIKSTSRFMDPNPQHTSLNFLNL